jgi:NADPH:quinone reductase-like Zn-dependent oxidoreductase
MKAVRYHSYGDSDVLVYEEADRPVAGAGQVVVRVAGTSFNPVDAAIRAGLLQQVFPVAFPHVPNFDVAGVAAQLAELVARVDAGVLQIEVAERRPLTDLAAVHHQATAGRLSGKTVLTPA